MDREVESFLKDIEKELAVENVAIFAGAGMSSGAGFVDWAELLRPIAEELGLDVNKEYDLVAIAQYHYNVNGSNRSQLNKRLIEEFSTDVDLTENHEILSRLPIRTFWTTNYDKLIEKSLLSYGKIADVKYTKDQLAISKPGREAIVYKMHGDIDHPNDAVLTKDDYEKYHVKMDQFITTLKGDLLTKTFIFIGFSFTDPNLDYILSRVRIAFENNQRRHYCFIRKISKREDEDNVDYEYRQRKQELFINDLGRFNIKAISVDEYDEITDYLKIIEYRFKARTVFISGAAHDYGIWGEKTSLDLIHNLSAKLIIGKHKIVSGFGLGIGSAVITGALESIYMKIRGKAENHLILRPFPQTASDMWKIYREDMIEHAGIAIFVFGNKLSDTEIIISDGMLQEYEIAKEKGVRVIAIGATGFAAKKIWELEMASLEAEDDVPDSFKLLYRDLGDESLSPDIVLGKTLEITSLAVSLKG